MECYYPVKTESTPWAPAQVPLHNPFLQWAAVLGSQPSPPAASSPTPEGSSPATTSSSMQPVPAHYQHSLQGGMLPQQLPQATGYPEPPQPATSFPSLLRPGQYLAAAAHVTASAHVPDNNTAPQQAHKSEPATKPAKTKLFTEDVNGEEVQYNGSAEQLERSVRGEKLERVYDCEGCEKAFTREEHLKRHAKIHTDEPVHRCEVMGCNKAYTRKERLTRHYKVNHLGQEPERPFWCNQCGKDFQRKEHLQRHERNIHGPGGSADMREESSDPDSSSGGGEERQDQAQYSIVPQPRVQQEVASRPQQQAPRQPRQQSLDESGNTPGGTLHCPYEACPKTYSRSGREHLNRHIKLHEGIEPERPFCCLDCGKTFTRKEHLLRHRRSHTGETPFTCPGMDCPKQFARKEHLKRHMRVHTGEHPYPCSECGRSFGRRERLLKHLKTHGINMEPTPRLTVNNVQNQQPKQEPVRQFKKEPVFIQEAAPSHGVFGSQTTELLKMITQKGPLSPDQLGMAQAQAYNLQAQNLEVRAALANPDVVRAFSNPEVVKAFTSPPKRPAVTSSGEVANSSQPVAVTSRGPDIANSPAVPPELSNLPPTFSIFPVVQGGEQGQASQGYYQAAPGYVTTHLPPTSLPMTWPTGWHMQPSPMVTVRSPAKGEAGGEGAKNHFPPAAAATYFRAPFS